MAAFHSPLSRQDQGKLDLFRLLRFKAAHHLRADEVSTYFPEARAIVAI